MGSRVIKFDTPPAFNLSELSRCHEAGAQSSSLGPPHGVTTSRPQLGSDFHQDIAMHTPCRLAEEYVFSLWISHRWTAPLKPRQKYAQVTSGHIFPTEGVEVNLIIWISQFLMLHLAQGSLSQIDILFPSFLRHSSTPWHLHVGCFRPTNEVANGLPIFSKLKGQNQSGLCWPCQQSVAAAEKLVQILNWSKAVFSSLVRMCKLDTGDSFWRPKMFKVIHSSDRFILCYLPSHISDFRRARAS